MSELNPSPKMDVSPSVGLIELDLDIASAARTLRATQQKGQRLDALAPATETDPRHLSYLNALRSSLQQLGTPVFLIDFISSVWARVLIDAAKRREDDAEMERLIKVGVALVMSTQPKTTAAQREALERTMPNLIFALESGMLSIGMNEAVRHNFYADLMPAQAEALRGGTVGAIAVTSGDAMTIHQALERVMSPRSFGLCA